MMAAIALNAHAQDGLATQSEPVVPLDENGIPLAAPAQVRNEILENIRKAKARMVPAVCADLTATPTPLPNGDMQFPVIPCKNVDMRIGPDTAQPQPTAPVARPQTAPAAVSAPVRAGQGTNLRESGPVASTGPDLNVLQMRRLGQLDAMQGRPINMGNASNLGSMQGYTEGQQRRMQGPTGGFGGMRR